LERENGPLLVMIHGGGFSGGSVMHEERNCRNWVRGGVVAVLVLSIGLLLKEVEDC
jgi:carboxylesterase type B